MTGLGQVATPTEWATIVWLSLMASYLTVLVPRVWSGRGAKAEGVERRSRRVFGAKWAMRLLRSVVVYAMWFWVATLIALTDALGADSMFKPILLPAFVVSSFLLVAVMFAARPEFLVPPRFRV